jgi:hypothetical protein
MLEQRWILPLWLDGTEIRKDRRVNGKKIQQNRKRNEGVWAACRYGYIYSTACVGIKPGKMASRMIGSSSPYA